MQPWSISVTHSCVVWGDVWETDVRQAFAAVGWTVTAMGPTCSSTHVEDDYLALTSSSKDFDPAILMDVLSQLGVHRVEYTEENGGTVTFRYWEAVIDEHWWGRCTDPRALVEAIRRSPLHGSFTLKNYENWRRKFWLCACAAGRFCENRFKHRAGAVFDVLDRFADGKASGTELRAARDAHLANDPSDPWPFFSPLSPYPYPFYDTPGNADRAFWEDAESFARAIVCEAFDELRQIPVAMPPDGQGIAPADPIEFERLSAAAKATLVPFVRDVFGNPFRPVKPGASWLQWHDRIVPKMAQAIYDDSAFDRLPILADALEEAGCTDHAVLDHCRQPGEHARGCWVIDLLLAND
jgi:hypothetical protein